MAGVQRVDGQFIPVTVYFQLSASFPAEWQDAEKWTILLESL
jgi:hypothetical protein